MTNLPTGPRPAVRDANDVARMLWAGLLYQFRSRADFLSVDGSTNYPSTSDVVSHLDGQIQATAAAIAAITGEPEQSIRTRAQAEVWS